LNVARWRSGSQTHLPPYGLGTDGPLMRRAAGSLKDSNLLAWIPTLLPQNWLAHIE
jgi:hypothetical protein